MDSYDIPTAQKAANGHALAVIDVENMGLVKIDDLAWTPSSQVAVAQARQDGKTFILDNGNIQATFQNDGHLISLYHKNFEREAIEPGKLANHFILFDDRPNDWEAWDVDVFHLEKRTEVHPTPTMQIVENGPLRASLAFEVQLSPVTTLKQMISVDMGSMFLDFSTDVEWHEKHKFLKVEFPFNIRASTATYEVQYGCVERPTHFNTSWDVAKFEVCAQRWADLYEPGLGVALLNDCKYGYSTHGNVVRLSLLRGSTSPDEEADMGHHSFRYRLYPHQSPVWQIGLHEDAQCLNTPLLIRKGRFEDTFPYFAINQDDDRYSVVLDTVKKAEDSNDVIVRLYEAYGTHSEIGLVIPRLPVKAVWQCNLLEQTEEKLEWAGGNIILAFTPFQIITLKLELDI